MSAQVFADEELERLREFPDVGSDDLVRFFTLTAADRAFVDPGRGQGPADRLGLAVAMCTLPWLRFYGRRAKTRTDHLRLVAQYLGWRPAATMEFKELDEFLLARAMEHDSPSLLFRLACEYLISAKVIRPGPITVVNGSRTPARKPSARPTIGSPPPSPTSGALRWTGCWSPIRRSGPAGCSGWGRARWRPRRRRCARRSGSWSFCACSARTSWTCRCCRPNAVGSWPRWGMRDALAERGRVGEDRQELLDAMLAVVADPAVPDDEVGGLIRGERIGWARLRAAQSTALPRLPRDHGHLAALAAGSYGYLRQFTPQVLDAVGFAGGTAAAELLAAVEVLRALNTSGARQVPSGAPTGFVPARWRGYLDAAAPSGTSANSNSYRRYWELCVLLGLRDGLRSGDVFVPGSRRHRSVRRTGAGQRRARAGPRRARARPGHR